MNKKTIGAVLALTLVSSTVFAAGIKFSSDIGLGFMNHSMFTKYKNNAGLQKELKEGLQGLGIDNVTINENFTKDSYNAFMAGLDLRIGTSMLFAEVGGYLSINLGLPSKMVTTTPSPLDSFLGNKGSNKLGGSIIMDTQAGVYLTFLENMPLNIHVGAGIAVNWTKTQREIPFAIYSKFIKASTKLDYLNEIRSITMVGGGFNVGVSYYFIKNVGIFLGVHDSIHIVNFHNQRYYKGVHENGTSFTATITKTQSIKNSTDKVVANNFGIKFAVAFKL